MSEFLMPVTDRVRDLFVDIADEMVNLFGISRPEAVARINARWRNQEFLREDEIILHEDERFWALVIYYVDVPDWAESADRRGWKVKAPPARDSGCWTLGDG